VCVCVCGSTTGDEFLEQQAIPHRTGWDLWSNLVALGVIAVGAMCCAYIQLRRMNNTN